MGLQFAYFFLRRELYGFVLVSKLQESGISRFISFDRMDYLDMSCRLITSILIFLSVLRMTRLLIIEKHLRILGVSLTYTLPLYHQLCYLYIILIIVISLSLYFWLGPFVNALHISETAFLTVMLHPFAPKENIEESMYETGGGWTLLFILFGVFAFKIMIHCFFAILVVWGWRKAKSRIWKEYLPYSFSDYFKERILRRPNRFDGPRKHHRTCYDERRVFREPIVETYYEESEESSYLSSTVLVVPGTSHEDDIDICRQYREDLMRRREEGKNMVYELPEQFRKLLVVEKPGLQRSRTRLKLLMEANKKGERDENVEEETVPSKPVKVEQHESEQNEEEKDTNKEKDEPKA